MGLSRLTKKCRQCPYFDTCEHKRMEALAYIDDENRNMISEVGQEAAMSAAAPILRETITIRVDGKPVIVYKDEIEKALYKHLYSGLGLRLGG